MYHVGIYLFDHVEVLDFAGPFEVFSVTADTNGEKLFRVFTVSTGGKAIKAVNGLTVLPDFSFKDHPPIDIFVVPGGVGTKVEINKQNVLDWLQKTHEAAQKTMTVCSGARLPGKLGLFDGLEVTTHQTVLAHLAEIAPRAKVVGDKRFIDHGRIMTCGGISAGIDGSLHVVRSLYGDDVANRTMIYMEYGDWEQLVK